jgi:ubiquinone/menaquinone biosynthesis C-methylase UbiE
MINSIKDALFRVWYWYISTKDKKGEITFMNYGMAGRTPALLLLPEQEKDRYSMQMYHHVANKIDLSGKSLLEVGCGRGGGLNYIKEQLNPRNITGLDLNYKAINFCRNFYDQTGATFLQGNAQNLPFEQDSFDVILNVESSHRYPEPQKFFDEVYRVLRPGGYFLFTDFRTNNEVPNMESQLKISRLDLKEKEDISRDVLNALDLSESERKKLINRLAPRGLRNLARKFAATPGTPTYNKFEKGEFIYLTYVMQKPIKP